MPWIWQHPDWPRFRWHAPRLAKAEARFILDAGILVGAAAHLDSDDRDRLTVEALTAEALTSSRIEGETLRRASVQSSVRRELGLAEAAPARTSAHERGIAEMLVSVYRAADRPLSQKTLFDWHRALTQGRRDLQDIGRYRTHAEPMRIISSGGGPRGARVHFEAPPSSIVPREMDRFIDWFNRTGPRGPEPLPPVSRAGAAHLYFESIHPFEDGNGRIGRAISELALADSLPRPVDAQGRVAFTALSSTILAHRRDYYTALARANHGDNACDITEFLAWFAAIALEAQERTIAAVRFIIDKTDLLDRLADRLNPRQSAALLRVLRAGPAGFIGGLSASKYAAITGASSATATRDLADMVRKGALVRTGLRRHARYHPPFPAQTTPRFHISPNGDVEQLR